MQLSLGFSPCPNDTFMMAALVGGDVLQGDLSFVPHIEDVETLNRWALEGKLDITKLSFSTWLRVQDQYQLLNTGAALGFGCGPLVIAKEPLTEEDIRKEPIAIPGELTTANLLFSMRYPDAQVKIPMLFSEIEGAILNGKVRAGVIIHENRFTYERKGLVKITDLGEYWEQETGMPIPLGAFVAKKSLGHERIQLTEKIIHDSIAYAFENQDKVMPYVRKYAQEMEEEVMAAHIRTYVNEFSLDLGETGMKAVQVLQQRYHDITLA